MSSKRGKTVYVSNLRKDISEGYLSRKFSKFGEIESLEIVMDPFTRESRGFGFINYERNKGAEQAIAKMNKKEMKKRILTVELSRRGKARPKTPGKYMGRGGG